MANFNGIPRGTLADRVYSEMRAAILNGTIPAGSELNQVSLARQFEVSRVPVREALNRLMAESLVSVTPYQQYVVAPIGARALVELIEIRAELEVFAARKRMAEAGPAVVDELRRLNRGLRAEEDTTLWFHGDIEFHHVLNGPDSEAGSLVRSLRERVHRYLRMVASTRARQLQACDEHDAIIEAFAAGDEVALEEVLRNHIQHTRTVILEHLQQAKELTP